MTAHYEADIVAWASEQARLLRSGRFDLLDTEHIAEEIEDVGKSEQRELASRMAVLLCHLIKWCYQPARQGASWLATIKTQHRLPQMAIYSQLQQLLTFFKTNDYISSSSKASSS